MAKSQQQVTKYTKKQGNMAQSKEQNKTPDWTLKKNRLLNFLMKNSKLLLKDIQLAIRKHRYTTKQNQEMHEQNENINKEIETIKKNQTEF